MSADEVPAQRDSLPVFDNHHGKPEVWPGLVVDGLVNRPTCFTANDLARLTARAIIDDFRCVDGWIVADQRWEGVPLSTLLANVNASPSARYAAISAADYTVAVPLGASDVEGVLLATRLNGESLPEQHGGPCRLVSVGQACYASIKWVDRIQLTHDMPVETAQQIAMARNRGVSGSTP